MNLTDAEFKEIQEIIYTRFGISLGEHKRSMVVNRLRKMAIQKGLNTFAELLQFVKTDSSGASLQEMADRISTNHTFFFREQQHFQLLSEKILPEIVEHLQKKRSNDLRIWCAAASTGEEPYSIVMTLMEYFGKDYQNWQAGLLATDLSSQALKKAISGVYSNEEIKNIPESMRKRYMQRLDQENWIFTKEVRKEITFRRFNLMNPVFPFRQPFHIIFCRNVMIYFDVPTRKNLIEKMYQITAAGGYFFVGHSESIRSLECPYDYIQPAVFKKRIDR